jgi:hypothetical protein
MCLPCHSACVPANHPVETCYDGVQNQCERGIDCGDVCRPCTQEELDYYSQEVIPITYFPQKPAQPYLTVYLTVGETLVFGMEQLSFRGYARNAFGRVNGANLDYLPTLDSEPELNTLNLQDLKTHTYTVRLAEARTNTAKLYLIPKYDRLPPLQTSERGDFTVDREKVKEILMRIGGINEVDELSEFNIRVMNDRYPYDFKYYYFQKRPGRIVVNEGNTSKPDFTLEMTKNTLEIIYDSPNTCEDLNRLKKEGLYHIINNQAYISPIYKKYLPIQKCLPFDI